MTRFKLLRLLLLLALLLPLAANARPGGNVSHTAGRITALLPEDHVLREEQVMDATKDMVLQWDDVVKTETGGRVRIELTDGSILNVGSSAQLHILRHDAVKQQTVLELLTGRLLLTAVRIAKKHGRFEVRSPVAVAGVVGTDFGLRVDPESADVVCREGTVRVRNTDGSVAGEVVLHGGEFTHVERGKAPTRPAAATPERLRAGEDATSIPDAR